MQQQDTSAEQGPVSARAALPPVEPPRRPKNKKGVKKMWSRLGIVGLCVAGSFLGAWLFVASGLVSPDLSRTLTDNGQKIVLEQDEVMADVFKQVSPSTVSITTRTVASRSLRAPEVTEGAGSGIILSADGYIMTNKHVVPEGISNIVVITSDGAEHENVRLVGRDPSNDIAFLKIEGVNNLTPAKIGNSDEVGPGQQVMAIGNALGMFRNSVSAGIISGTGRPVTASDEASGVAEQLDDMFQTDAAINPGNSGGPLVNLKGEVIGMNTAVSAEGQSLGFAIPVNDAKVLINSVLTQGKLIKAYLGVRYVPLNPDMAGQLGLGANSGAFVQSPNDQPAVIAGSPAEKAGLKAGDIITKVDNRDITVGKGLASILSQKMPGDRIELTFLRDDREQKVSVVLGEYPQ